MKKVFFIRKNSIKVFLSLLVLFAVILTLNSFFTVEISRANLLFAKVKGVFTGTSMNKGDFSKEGKLAIIIDDFGGDSAGVKEMMAIEEHLTFAVMPFLPNTEQDAKLSHEKGYEVIVHLPMEANKGKLSWLGPRPIMAAMTRDEIEDIVEDAFESVPYAVGANIHMGSKASANKMVIATVLEYLQDKDLYFVDSCTAKEPIGKKMADDRGIPSYDRDVFLDGNKSKDFVKKRLALAGELALKQGHAVAIGHVGPEGGKVTAAAIKEMLPEFAKNNVKLVFVSELHK